MINSKRSTIDSAIKKREEHIEILMKIRQLEYEKLIKSRQLFDNLGFNRNEKSIYIVKQILNILIIFSRYNYQQKK